MSNYAKVDEIDDDVDLEYIESSVKIHRKGILLFNYDAEKGILWLNNKKGCIVGLNDLDNPVDLCFPDPLLPEKHYCFKNVKQIICMSIRDEGLISRFSRYIRSLL